MNDMSGAFQRFAIGQPMRRLEDQRFITGTGRYADDWTEPGLLHTAFLRAPLAHAELRRVDAAAARGVELRLTNNRLVVNAMETRGAIARWDAAKQRFELTGSIQNPFTFRALLCELFGWKPEQLHGFASDVGGGFGCKNQVQPE